MNCNNCLCPKCANSACSNYDARVCDTEEIKYLKIQNPSCLVSECTDFSRKKED